MTGWDGRQKGRVEGRIKDRLEKGSTNPKDLWEKVIKKPSTTQASKKKNNK